MSESRDMATSLDNPTQDTKQEDTQVNTKKPRGVVTKKLKLKGMDKKKKPSKEENKVTREQLLDERVKAKSDRYCMST